MSTVNPETSAALSLLNAGAVRERAHRMLGGARAGVDILTRSHAPLLEALEAWCTRRPDVRGSFELLLAGSVTDGDPSDWSVRRTPPIPPHLPR